MTGNSLVYPWSFKKILSESHWGFSKDIRDMSTDFKYMIDILEYVELFKFHDNTRTYQY